MRFPGNMRAAILLLGVLLSSCGLFRWINVLDDDNRPYSVDARYCERHGNITAKDTVPVVEISGSLNFLDSLSYFHFPTANVVYQSWKSCDAESKIVQYCPECRAGMLKSIRDCFASSDKLSREERNVAELEFARLIEDRYDQRAESVSSPSAPPRWLYSENMPNVDPWFEYLYPLYCHLHGTRTKPDTVQKIYGLVYGLPLAADYPAHPTHPRAAIADYAGCMRLPSDSIAVRYCSECRKALKQELQGLATQTFGNQESERAATILKQFDERPE
jgi:hypothetical protein